MAIYLPLFFQKLINHVMTRASVEVYYGDTSTLNLAQIKQNFLKPPPQLQSFALVTGTLKWYLSLLGSNQLDLTNSTGTMSLSLCALRPNVGLLGHNLTNNYTTCGCGHFSDNPGHQFSTLTFSGTAPQLQYLIFTINHTPVNHTLFQYSLTRFSLQYLMCFQTSTQSNFCPELTRKFSSSSHSISHLPHPLSAQIPLLG